jgi:signal transduction histidine kinase
VLAALLLAGAADAGETADVALGQPWRWRRIDGPDGTDTVLRLVRPGRDGGLLAQDDRGLVSFDGWRWTREPHGEQLSGEGLTDLVPLPGGVLAVIGERVLTADSLGVATLARAATTAQLTRACVHADGAVDLVVDGVIVQVGLHGLQPLQQRPPGTTVVLALAHAPDGRLVCNTDLGMFVEVEGAWQPVPMRVPERDSVPRYMFALRTPEGVVFLPERVDDTQPALLWDGYRIRVLPDPEVSFQVVDAAVAQDGSVILATNTSTLHVLRGGTWSECRVPLPTQESVTSLCITSGGRLATVFASGRLAVCDLASSEWEQFDTSRAGLGMSVNALLESSRGGMWVATDRGLARLTEDGFTDVHLQADELQLRGITAVAEDAEGGLWVGSGSAFPGAARLVNGRWMRHAEPGALGHGFVHSMLADGDSLWFALLGDVRVWDRGGIVRWRDGRFDAWLEEPGGGDVPRAYSFLRRADGTLLAGLNRSLRRFDGSAWLHDPTVPLGDKRIFSLHEDRDGALWAGFGRVETGVAVLRDGGWKLLTGGDWKLAAAASFAQTPDGRLWLASNKGLFHVLDDECHEISGRLPMRTFWPMLGDGSGGVWLGTLGEGLLHFRPADHDPPVVRRLEVSFGGPGEVLLTWDAMDRWNATPQDELSFRMELDGGPAERLEGKGLTRWPLSDLEPGPHTLRIVPADSLGNADGQQLLHSFEVPPPPWRTAPVLAGAGATALALAWLGVVVRNRRRERAAAANRQRELNERLSALTLQLLSSQEAERRRISREMHDDLGQLLTAACLDIERAARLTDPERRGDALRSALNAARDTQRRVREISHMLRPTELDDHGLPQAVATVLSDFTSRSGIDVESRVELDHLTVPSDVANHVFRILQEALTNILRHARASTAFVTLRATDGRIELTVRDDGAGFDPHSHAPGTSLGLLGMRERSELLGGKFSIRSQPAGGTEVSVSIPLPAR